MSHQHLMKMKTHQSAAANTKRSIFLSFSWKTFILSFFWHSLLYVCMCEKSRTWFSCTFSLSLVSPCDDDDFQPSVHRSIVVKKNYNRWKSPRDVTKSTRSSPLTLPSTPPHFSRSFRVRLTSLEYLFSLST